MTTEISCFQQNCKKAPVLMPDCISISPLSPAVKKSSFGLQTRFITLSILNFLSTLSCVFNYTYCLTHYSNVDRHNDNKSVSCLSLQVICQWFIYSIQCPSKVFLHLSQLRSQMKALELVKAQSIYK